MGKNKLKHKKPDKEIIFKQFGESSSSTLKDINENTEVKKIFTQNTNYEVSTIHSDTINNEKNATKNILQQLSNDMINFIVITTRY